MILPAVDPGGTYGWASRVTDWCLGENDLFTTCALAGIGNGHAVVTSLLGSTEIMTDGEIERMFAEVAGFMPTDPATDHGVALIAVLDYWRDHGWAGDPTLVPRDRMEIGVDQVAAAIDAMGWAYCWFRLPLFSGDPDLSDRAVARGLPGIAPHCMTVIQASPDRFDVVTWGERRTVSGRWLRTYFAGGYAVDHPLWRRPTERLVS